MEPLENIGVMAATRVSNLAGRQGIPRQCRQSCRTPALETGGLAERPSNGYFDLGMRNQLGHEQGVSVGHTQRW